MCIFCQDIITIFGSINLSWQIFRICKCGNRCQQVLGRDFLTGVYYYCLDVAIICEPHIDSFARPPAKQPQCGNYLDKEALIVVSVTRYSYTLTMNLATSNCQILMTYLFVDQFPNFIQFWKKNAPHFYFVCIL
jgi:hypothetical protein